MGKVNGETRSKRAKWRTDLAVIPGIHVFGDTPKQ
jgi:hypothetical protein